MGNNCLPSLPIQPAHGDGWCGGRPFVLELTTSQGSSLPSGGAEETAISHFRMYLWKSLHSFITPLAVPTLALRLAAALSSTATTKLNCSPQRSTGYGLLLAAGINAYRRVMSPPRRPYAMT